MPRRLIDGLVPVGEVLPGLKLPQVSPGWYSRGLIWFPRPLGRGRSCTPSQERSPQACEQDRALTFPARSALSSSPSMTL